MRQRDDGTWVDDSGNPIPDTGPGGMTGKESGGLVSSTASGGDEFDASKVPSGVPVDWARDFIRRNPGDYGRLASAYGSGQTGGGSSSGGGGMSGSTGVPSWYQDWFDTMRKRQEEQDATNKARGDSLYNTLLERINQSKTINENDPSLLQQTGAFRGEQTRAMRNYLADLAEASTPDTNLRGETRLANEKLGQNLAGFKAQLLSHMTDQRLADINSSLNSALGFVSGSQAQELQREANILGEIASSRSAGLQGRSMDLNWDLGLRNLGLNEWDRQMFYDLLQRGLIK